MITDGAGNITWQNSADSLQVFEVVNDTTLRIIEGNGEVFDVSLDHFATDIELSDVQIGLLAEIDADSTYLNDSIDQVAADLANFIANSTDIKITEGMIIGTDLALINSVGDPVIIDIASLATDAEVADIETAIYNEIDAESTYLNDSIVQVAANLLDEVTFLLNELADDSTYLNDSIDQVALDLANYIATNFDTNITEGLIVGTDLALINSAGET